MPWLAFLFPFASALALALAGRWLGRAGLTLGASMALVITLELAAGVVLNGTDVQPDWHRVTAPVLTLTPVGGAFLLMVPMVALLVVLYAGYHERLPSNDPPGTQGNPARLLAWTLALVGGLALLALAGDWLTLLVAWEVTGLCTWRLMALEWGRGVPDGALGGLWWLRCGALGLYVTTATLMIGPGGIGIAGLAELDGVSGQVAALGIVLAAMARSGQVPFSPWLFASASGPVPVSALLHTVALVATGLYLIIRVQPSLTAIDWFNPAIMTIAVVTAWAGCGVALFQGHARKLLSASTSVQFGLMWLAVGAGYPGAALMYFITHAFMKAGLFLSAGAAARRAGTFMLAYMRMGREMPVLAATTLLSVLALAGIDPLGAAWAKEKVIAAAGSQATWLALGVMPVGFMTAIFATRFQRLVYGRPLHDRPGPGVGPALRKPETWALRGLAICTLLLSLLWVPALHRPLMAALEMRSPTSQLWMHLLSLSLALLGIVIGVRMTRRARQGIEPSREQAFLASWYGLYPLICRVGQFLPGKRMSPVRCLVSVYLGSVGLGIALLAAAWLV
ncbi:MAG: proton-conducting transporter membrane subunit [Halomonas sp.]|nr:proton-conducting transporter membrane subunit [Halomonas sp.]